jgi:hypothetical protein
MSTKSSVAYNNGKDGRTDFHLYMEGWADTLHLRIKDVEAEVILGKNYGLTTLQIPADIVDDIIEGLLLFKERIASRIDAE